MDRLSRKETQARTRQRIKEVALAALDAEGAAGLRIEHITRQAGYTRGAFYANFSSRAELLLEIVQDRVPEELRFWNILFEHADDPTGCLADVIADSQELSRGRASAKLELQLEAERNESFRPRYQAYLDVVYAELMTLFATILRRHGRAAPFDIHLKIAGVYVLGSSLGLRASLGFRDDHRQASFALMHDYIRYVIESAPAARAAAERSRERRMADAVAAREAETAFPHSRQNLDSQNSGG